MPLGFRRSPHTSSPSPLRWTSRRSCLRPPRLRHRRDNVAEAVLFEPATLPTHTRRDDHPAARLVIRKAMVGSPYPVRMGASPHHLATNPLKSAARIGALLGARHG